MICVKLNLWPKDRVSLFLLLLRKPVFLLQGWNTFPSASVLILEEPIMVFSGLTSCLRVNVSTKHYPEVFQPHSAKKK